MHYHIILTELCNSECRYCYEKSMKEFDNELDNKFKFDFSAPAKSVVDVKKLKKFFEKDDNPVLIFYGGEPLLEIEKIKEIMDELGDSVKYRMQTNGKLLNELDFKYIKKIDKILISIDGDKERTDFNKGKGTYDKVIENINLIRKNGYKGEIIARMTLSEFTDVYEQVLHLFSIGFDAVHWQLDAGFFKFDFNEKEFSKFIKNYNKSVDKLIDYWTNEMKKGRVLRIYPFIGIVDSLLKNEKTGLRCGAGYAGYAIGTDGRIYACPIMNCVENFNAGNLNSDARNLKKFDVSGRCLKCNYRDLCGGRCLYWNQAGLWPEEGDDLICNTIRHLIDILKKKMKEVEKMIKNKIISEKDFEYEKYFGPEIIP